MAENSASILDRRERRKLEVDARIKAAAIKLLSIKALEDLTVDELSEEADVSKKTFYNYYPSKQDLIEDISQTLLMAESAKNFAAAMEKFHTTQERLHYFVVQQGKNLSDAELLKRNLIKHAMLDLSVNTERSRAKLENSINIFERLFIEGQKIGDVNDKYSPRFLAEMIAGMLETSAIHWIHLPDYPVNKRFKELNQLMMDIAIK